jgi:2-hydroxycyclohexanecarboxyl-CoA dehydrogenase
MATAFIAGGGGRLGAAAGERLAAEGWRVILADANLRAAQEAAQRIGPQASAIELDITDLAAVKRAVKEAGAIGALINAAGGRTFAEVGPFTESSPDTWRPIIDLHLRGVLNTCHAVLPGMIAQGRGVIISLIAVEAFRGEAEGAAFATAKAGVLVLTETLVRECQPHNIRVNAVIPGHAKALARTGSNDDAAEVAEAIAYLASDRASRTTGATLDVSSGWALH